MEPITDGNVISISVEARKIPGVYIVFTHRTAFHCLRASLVAQMVKNVPALQETWVQPLGQEDPLEKGMATHSSILGEFHGQRSLAGYSPPGD